MHGSMGSRPCVEIQKADAVRLCGPHAVFKDVGLALLEIRCEVRTATRHQGHRGEPIRRNTAMGRLRQQPSHCHFSARPVRLDNTKALRQNASRVVRIALCSNAIQRHLSSRNGSCV